MLYTFEDQKKPSFIYNSYNHGQLEWQISSELRYDGTYSLRSPTIPYTYELFSAEIVADVDGPVSFYYMFYGYPYNDYFRFYVNGDVRVSSRYVGWSSYGTDVKKGDIIRFEYQKNYYYQYNYSCVFIDYLKLPVVNKYTINGLSTNIINVKNEKINTKKCNNADSLISLGSNTVSVSHDNLDADIFKYYRSIHVYNLFSEPLDAIQVNIEPKTLSDNINGFNEIKNGLFILNDHYIDLIVDGECFHLIEGRVGESISNPIMFRRNIYNDEKYLFGNDKTLFKSDWIKYINSAKENSFTLNSLPSSGNIEYDKDYFMKNFLNISSPSYIKIDIYYKNNIDDSLKEIVTSYIRNNINLSITSPTYAKNISNQIGIIYDEPEIIMENDTYNIRW